MKIIDSLAEFDLFYQFNNGTWLMHALRCTIEVENFRPICRTFKAAAAPPFTQIIG
jgi:hypothetical protein